MTLLTHWTERLRVLNACDPSLSWSAIQESPLEAWRMCERGDWMLWVAARLGVDRRLIVTAACKCARLALVYVPKDEDRPIKAIEAAERWAAGLVTIEELRCAVDAARAVYTDVSTVSSAAISAEYAAYAAYAPYVAEAAAHAAGNAAKAAAYAAASAAKADDYAAKADAYYAVLSQCSDIVRSVISEDVMREAWSSEEKVK